MENSKLASLQEMLMGGLRRSAGFGAPCARGEDANLEIGAPGVEEQIARSARMSQVTDPRGPRNPGPP
jgi:hypothetical protein